MYNYSNQNYLDGELSKHFNYDKIFHLIDYDHDMSLLYHEIKLLTKSEYPPTYRFIFYHWDTDYYITNTQPGLILRNLQRLLFELDISNFFCLIISQQNIKDQLEQLRIEETTDEFPIASITTMLQPVVGPDLITRHAQVNLNVESIEKKYICLNRAKRFHRTLLYSCLKHYNLLDDGIVSYATRS